MSWLHTAGPTTAVVSTPPISIGGRAEGALESSGTPPCTINGNKRKRGFHEHSTQLQPDDGGRPRLRGHRVCTSTRVGAGGDRLPPRGSSQTPPHGGGGAAEGGKRPPKPPPRAPRISPPP